MPGALIAAGLSQAAKKINGRWRGAKMELRNGDTGEKNTFDGKPYQTNALLEFKDDGWVLDLLNHGRYSYSIRENILLIGNRSYIIARLTDKELILLDYDSKHPEDPFAFRTYYVKEK